MLKRFGMVASVLALLAVALAGCKNGMLREDEATVNGLRDVGNRTAKVTITNFENDGNGATRSVVGGPLRTIAPEEIPVADLAADYVLLATGYSHRATMAPKIISVDTAGRADLTGLDAGVWTLTINAYNKTELQRLDPDYATAPDQIVGTGDDALRLTGSAIVDLTRSSSQVNITLTSDGVGTEGTVNFDVVLDQDDLQKINTSTYHVTFGIYDTVTGNVIAGSEKDESVAAQAQMPEINFTANGARITTGSHIFKVTIKDPAGKLGPWTWSDVILVDGNTVTDNSGTGRVQVDKIIGEPPTEPENFAAYWKKDTTTETEYTVTFAWDRKSFNESHFELQILDITDKFTATAGDGNAQYDSQALNVNADDVWTKIKAQTPDEDEKGILTAENFASVNFPVYGKAGTLNAGGTSVDYRLKPGQVYAVRLRSANKQGKSDWVHFNVAGEPASKPAVMTNVEKLKSYIVNVFNVKYNLNGFMLLKDGATNPYNQLNDKLTTALESAQFDPDTPHTLTRAVDTQSELGKGLTMNGGANKYRLYESSFAGTAAADQSIQGWNNWLDELNRTKKYANTDPYKDFKNVSLIPGGASSSAIIDILTSGTHANLLTDKTVWLDLNPNPDTRVAIHSWVDTDVEHHKVTTDVSRLGIIAQVGHVGGKLAIELRAAALPADTQYLHLTVGTDPDDQAGKFTGGTKDRFADYVTYTIEATDGNVIKRADGRPSASIEVTGMNSGDYILRVVAEAGPYKFSYQVPFMIKYTDETVTP